MNGTWVGTGKGIVLNANQFRMVVNMIETGALQRQVEAYQVKDLGLSRKEQRKIATAARQLRKKRIHENRMKNIRKLEREKAEQQKQQQLKEEEEEEIAKQAATEEEEGKQTEGKEHDDDLKEDNNEVQVNKEEEEEEERRK